MSSLLIVKPIAATAVVSQSFPTMSRMLSPDPKEAFTVPAGGSAGIILDYGTAVTADTAFSGYHTATQGQQWTAQACDAQGNPTGTIVGVSALQAPGYGPPYHGFGRVGVPLTSRYFRFDYNTAGGGASYSVGVIALGLAFQPTWGHEWGAGRPIEDTGNAERLFGGGFGIDDGVAAGGYAWTCGDLQPAEIRQLYQLVRERRTTRSVLVVEDPDQTDGLNERIHWGLFRKLDTYERLDPLNTKWSLQIGDWA